MRIMNMHDQRELERYRAMGSPDEIMQYLNGEYPDNDDRAPLPWSEDESSGYISDGTKVEAGVFSHGA